MCATISVEHPQALSSGVILCGPCRLPQHSQQQRAARSLHQAQSFRTLPSSARSSGRRFWIWLPCTITCPQQQSLPASMLAQSKVQAQPCSLACFLVRMLLFPPMGQASCTEQHAEHQGMCAPSTGAAPGRAWRTQHLRQASLLRLACVAEAAMQLREPAGSHLGRRAQRASLGYTEH